ncbi:MAG: hypothetical protein L0287_28430, partial [Anaerolineae bacterium]|nr:hypothetical protein [Anaerolineae bacterium]
PQCCASQTMVLGSYSSSFCPLGDPLFLTLQKPYIDGGLYLKFRNKWRIIKMSPKTNEGDEYDLPPVNRPKVTRAQWNKVHEALIAVEESEADFGRPIGNHYKLQLVLYELGCGLIHDKKEMKRIAQEIIDNGYI